MQWFGKEKKKQNKKKAKEKNLPEVLLSARDKNDKRHSPQANTFMTFEDGYILTPGGRRQVTCFDFLILKTSLGFIVFKVCGIQGCDQ